MDFKKWYEGSPEEQEQAIVKGCIELFEKAQTAKEHDKNVKEWEKYDSLYEMEYMKHFSNKPLNEWQSQTLHGQAFQLVETIKPFILSGKPRFTARPMNEESIRRSDMANQIYLHQCEYEKTGFKNFKKDTCHDMLVLGTCVGAVDFTNAFDNMGEVFFRQVDPINFFPDPRCHSLQDAEYVIEIKYEDIDSLVEKYPNKADKIKPKDDTDTSRNSVASMFNDEPDSEIRLNDTQVLIAYIRDMETEEAEEDDPITGEKIKTTKYKYGTRGRQIVIVGSAVIYDGINPYPCFPYAMGIAYKLPSRTTRTGIWGMSPFEPVKMDIIDTTKRKRAINDVLHSYAYPKRRAPKGMDISNDPEEIIYCDPGEYEEFSPKLGFTQDLLLHKRESESDAEKITGQTATVQGVQDYAGQSGKAIRNLQTLGTKKNVQLAQNYYDFLSEMATISLKIAVDSYGDDKQIAEYGKDGEIKAFKELNDYNTETQSRNPETDISNIDFTLVLSVEEGIFTTRQQKEEKAMTYYQAGLWGPKYVIKYTDMPDGEEILAELAAIEQANMEMMKMGGQQPNPGGKGFGVMMNGTDRIQSNAVMQ